ncbi:MAG: hypothetical protein K0R57_5285 [Paenibacillaceae bacterium]|jgi:hypothetical protein|nr:hypothetical protein [Paenibacillaceae bacterium]
MLIDLHTHGKLTKKSDFSLDYFRESVREAQEAGLTALALTEHFNTKQFDDIYCQLDKSYPYRGDYYDADGFRIFPGMEVDAAPSGHFLMIGPRDVILALRRQLDGHTLKGSFLPLADLLDLTDGMPLLRIGAHPLRESNSLETYDWRLIRRLDALDLNAKDLHTYGAVMEAKVRRFAQATGLPVVGGSDTHQPLQFGSICNRLEQECETVEELRQCILQGGCKVSISPCLDTKVKAASAIKKLLKQQLAERQQLQEQLREQLREELKEQLQRENEGAIEGEGAGQR